MQISPKDVEAARVCLSVAHSSRESSIRTSVLGLVRAEEERVRERAEAERRSLDHAVRARVAAEEAARAQERLRDEAEGRLRDQRERAAREEGARLEATHHASVVAMREKLERDLAELDALKAQTRAQLAAMRARAHTGWGVAMAASCGAIAAFAFAFLVRDPAGSVARLREFEGEALVLRDKVASERAHGEEQKRRAEALERTVDELRNQPVAAASAPAATSAPPRGPRGHLPPAPPIRTTPRDGTCQRGDPLCPHIP